MRGHAETKKNEQKTEKNNEMHKNTYIMNITKKMRKNIHFPLDR